MRRLMAIALVALGILVPTGTAHAANGWTKYKGTWIEYHYSTKTSFENPRVVNLLLDRRREKAIHRAQSTRDEHILALLRRAQAIIDNARATIYGGNTSGFPASCVAWAEEYGPPSEGGHNTSAGYFGMIYSPASYPEPGPTYAKQYGNSWWNIPYSAQVQIAVAEYHKYGSSAWGLRTRERCF